ncbi:MAG: hypothetical protein U5M50_07455 [Sphingobium sp.]|nr:hypothetical protein [Sphingobium sp.]
MLKCFPEYVETPEKFWELLLLLFVHTQARRVCRRGHCIAAIAGHGPNPREGGARSARMDRRSHGFSDGWGAGCSLALLLVVAVGAAKFVGP